MINWNKLINVAFKKNNDTYFERKLLTPYLFWDGESSLLIRNCLLVKELMN